LSYRYQGPSPKCPGQRIRVDKHGYSRRPSPDLSLPEIWMYSTNSSGEATVKAASTLPIIDIAPWTEGHDHKGRLSTAAAIHAACLEFGFFYLDVSAFVSPDEPEELSHLAREFFGLPQEEKDKISLSNQDGARGEPTSPSYSQTSPSLVDLTS
jgi:non-haem dioxygenase in morphine synthesis N-terminal